MVVHLKAMWSPGFESLYKGKNPQAVADEIYSIGEKPTKEQIVDKARDENTELHDMFEWRDDVAAEKYRCEQAGTIMRHLKVVFVESNEESPEQEKTFNVARITDKPVRAFYGDPRALNGFVSITTIMNDQETYNALLRRAKDELVSFERKYSILKELEPLFEVIHGIL